MYPSSAGVHCSLFLYAAETATGWGTPDVRVCADDRISPEVRMHRTMTCTDLQIYVSGALPDSVSRSRRGRGQPLDERRVHRGRSRGGGIVNPQGMPVIATVRTEHWIFQRHGCSATCSQSAATVGLPSPHSPGAGQPCTRSFARRARPAPFSKPARRSLGGGEFAVLPTSERLVEHIQIEGLVAC